MLSSRLELSICFIQRKFSKKTSVIQKVESQEPDALRSEVSMKHCEGYLCSACGLATGLPRFRNVADCNARANVFGGLAWQAQHFGNLRCTFCGRRSILRPCKVKYRFRGRRSILARSSTDFVAGAALSQGQVIDR